MNEATEVKLERKYSFSVRIAHEIKALRHATAICPNTREEANYILKHYEGTRSGQISVIPNGVDATSSFQINKESVARLRWKLGIAQNLIRYFY